jgi:hypothetical protein
MPSVARVAKSVLPPQVVRTSHHGFCGAQHAPAADSKGSACETPDPSA